MSQILFTPDAVDDINTIWQNIAVNSITNADKFIDKLYTAFEQLARMPLSARKRPELGQHIRSRALGNYVIFYEPVSEEEGILVLNILEEILMRFLTNPDTRIEKSLTAP